MVQKSGLFCDSLAIFGKNLTICSKVDNPINSLNIENSALIMVEPEGIDFVYNLSRY